MLGLYRKKGQLIPGSVPTIWDTVAFQDSFLNDLEGTLIALIKPCTEHNIILPDMVI